MRRLADVSFVKKNKRERKKHFRAVIQAREKSNLGEAQYLLC